MRMDQSTVTETTNEMTVNPEFQSWLRGSGLQSNEMHENQKWYKKNVNANGALRKASSSSVHTGWRRARLPRFSSRYTEGDRGEAEAGGGGEEISRQQMWKSTCGGSVFSVECQWAEKAPSPGGSRSTCLRPAPLRPRPPPPADNLLRCSRGCL